MIDPTHFRIGNWVTYLSWDEDKDGMRFGDPYDQVVGFDTLAHMVQYPEEYDPIPLRPEVFKKCQIPDPWFSDFLKFYEADTETESKVVAVFKYRDGDSYLHDRRVKVEYLHQLQNLYHSLYNEEIIYQP